MTDKKSNHVSKFIIDMIMIVFSLFRVVPNIMHIAEAEAKQAGKSLSSLLMLYLFAGALVTSTWICLLTICFIYFISLNIHPILSLTIIVIINILLIIITAFVILKTKNKLSFQKTRHLLRNVTK